MPKRAHGEVVSVRLPPEILARVLEVGQGIGKGRSQTVRMLLGAALGDDASTIAVSEAGMIMDSARRHLLAGVAEEVGPAFERARERFDEAAREGER